MRFLLLEDENDDLHAQLAQDDDRIDGVERHNHALEEDLEVCQDNLESAQCDLRMKTREIETLKVQSEISSNGKEMLTNDKGATQLFARSDNGFD